jgi:hypothetical protein
MENLELVDGGVAEVTGVCGLHLSARVQSNERVELRLIDHTHCKSSETYWRAWKRAGGVPVLFEDGTTYDPSTAPQPSNSAGSNAGGLGGCSCTA